MISQFGGSTVEASLPYSPEGGRHSHDDAINSFFTGHAEQLKPYAATSFARLEGDHYGSGTKSVGGGTGDERRPWVKGEDGTRVSGLQNAHVPQALRYARMLQEMPGVTQDQREMAMQGFVEVFEAGKESLGKVDQKLHTAGNRRNRKAEQTDVWLPGGVPRPIQYLDRRGNEFQTSRRKHPRSYTPKHF